MIKKVLVHIGTPKTGSTAIQLAFQDAKVGPVQFAQLGDPNQSLALLSIFSTQDVNRTLAEWEHRGLNNSQKDKWRAEATALLENCIDQPGLETLVVSGEAVLFMRPEALTAMRDYFYRRASEVEIICYLRHPLSQLQSQLQERIRTNAPKQFPDWLNYQNLLQKFINVFGPEHVHLREYNRDKFPRGNVVLDFALATGLPVPATLRPDANPSLSTVALKLLYLLNQSAIQTGGSPAHLEARLKSIHVLRKLFPGPRHFPTAELLGTWRQSDCDWLESFAGIRFEKPDVSESDQMPLHEFLSDIHESDAITLAEFLQSRNVLAVSSAEPKQLVQQLYTWCLENPQS